MTDWTYTPPKKVPWQKRVNVPLPPDWRKRRDAQIKRSPRCQYTEGGVRCIQPADEVDHIIPRFEGGTSDKANLMSLCSYHHNLKTHDESQRAWASHKKKVAERFDFTEEHPLKL